MYKVWNDRNQWSTIVEVALKNKLGDMFLFYIFDGKPNLIKFVLSKKATKIEEIFTVDLTLYSKCQIEGEDFDNFSGLYRKQELY